MPIQSFRLSDEMYNSIKAVCDRDSLSLSNFLRDAVEHKLNGCNTSDESINSVVQMFTNEIQTKNQQIDQLHQLLAMAQRTNHDTVKQLESANGKVEVLMQGKVWWKVLFGK